MKLMKRLLTVLLCMVLLVVSFPVFEEEAEAAPKYYIEVDITNQMVTVYLNGNRTNSGIVRQMICSTGKSSSPTPTGTYTLPAKKRSTERTLWYRFSGCWGKWATRIKGGYLFHSVPYKNKGDAQPIASYYAKLGSQASAGCVRLRDADAYWIAMNCPAGTKVKIFKSGKRNNELRSLLLKGTFSVSEQSYDEYLGIANVIARKGDSGEKVQQIQARLNLLGYAAGSADGSFGTSTYNAVVAFQKAAGIAQNGLVTERVWDRLFADNAPLATAGKTSGATGVHIMELQKALKVLKFYSGEAHGKYDSATVAAVNAFQASIGMTPNGNATNYVQRTALTKAAQLLEQFGDTEYEAIINKTTKNLATVKVNSTLNLRKSASTSSKSLAKLKNGAVVTVLKKGSTWTQVKYNNLTGYLKNSYLKFYSTTTSSVTYQPVPTIDPNAPTPTPTPTPDPNATPKPVASSETLVVGSTGDAVTTLQRALKELRLYEGELSGTFDDATAAAVKTFQAANGLTANGKATTAVQTKILAKAESVRSQFTEDYYTGTVTTTKTTKAKVNVNSYLNLRKSASTSSKSLAKLKNSTVVTVVKKGSTWSQVKYNNLTGYLKNTYLTFSTTTTTTVTYEALPTPEPTATPEITPTPTPDPSVTVEPNTSVDPDTSVEPDTSVDPEVSTQPTDDAGDLPSIVDPTIPASTTPNPDESAEPAPAASATANPGESDDAESTETPAATATAVVTATPTAASTEEPGELYAIVKSDGVKLYKTAEADEQNIAATVNEGEYFDVVSAISGWYAVKYEGDTVYVTEDDVKLSITKPAATDAPAELSDAAPVVTETPVPTETPAPTETAAPTETPAPTETAAPTETPAPTETAAPTETPAPTETAAPTETPAPTETSTEESAGE